MALHIVHLEDERSLREATRIVLKELEPDVDLRQFEDSDSALDYIEQHASTIDLYLLDIRVPGSRDGLQIAEKIVELDTTGAIVFTSAYDSPKREVLDKLNAQYLRKPYGIEPTAKMLLEIARQGT
jgi:DNA-binding LytR/AlgR family response regulator